MLLKERQCLRPVKTKYADFRQITRSQSPRGGIDGRDTLEAIPCNCSKRNY
jgi:hypothetical protein